MKRVRLVFVVAAFVAAVHVADAEAAPGLTLAGVACETPPPVHCVGDCSSEQLRNQGNATEPTT
jgi:hypothetical protein